MNGNAGYYGWSMAPSHFGNFGPAPVPQLPSWSTSVPCPPAAFPHAIYPTTEEDLALARELASARKSGGTHLQALESFATSKQHPSALWKDYYLSHTDRLEALVRREIEGTHSSRGEQREDSDGASQGQRLGVCEVEGLASPIRHKLLAGRRNHSPTRSSSTSRSTNTSATPTSASSKRKVALTDNLPAKRPRTSANPLPKHTQLAANMGQGSYRGSARAGKEFHDIPPVPSRSPTPPDEAIFDNGRTVYTEADRNFFILECLRVFQRKPTISRQDLGCILEKKVPHHNMRGWMTYISRNADLTAAIRAKATGDDQPRASSSRSQATQHQLTPKMHVSSASLSDSRANSESNEDYSTSMDEGSEYKNDDGRSFVGEELG